MIFLVLDQILELVLNLVLNLDLELVQDLDQEDLDLNLDLKPIFSTPGKPAEGKHASWYKFKCTLSCYACCGEGWLELDLRNCLTLTFKAIDSA